MNLTLLHEIECKTCGYVFTARKSANRKFCSLGCAYQLKGRFPSRKKDRGVAFCQGCGIEFQLTRTGGTKYCTHHCAASTIGKATMIFNRNKAPRATFGPVVCKNCNTIFNCWKSAKRKFCSNKCSATYETERKITERKAGRMKNIGSSTHSRSKKGWVECGGKRFFSRSSWEKKYAFYLQWLKTNGQILEWEHEPDTFWFEKIKRGVRSYLPDFKITIRPETVEYHEVKGWMDAKSKTKIKRMAKYHPQIVLRIIGDKWFKENRRKLSGIIPGW